MVVKIKYELRKTQDFLGTIGVSVFLQEFTKDDFKKMKIENINRDTR